jgi:hypothetical protein
MKLTKKLIKKLVMESLEESPVGGSPEVVSSMTTTNPMDNHGENGTFEELRDGSFRLMDKQGNEVTLSPEEMEKLVAQYEESKGYEGGHEAAEPEAPVQEISAALQEGRVTKSGLQNIIKEEYKKLLKESEPGDAGYDKYGRRIKSTFSGTPRNLPTDTGNVELDALGYQSMNFPGLNNELIQASEHIKQGGTLDNLPDELKKKLTHTFLFKTFLPYAQKMARNK